MLNRAGERLVKGRPAGAGVELGVGGEQLIAAGGAGKRAVGLGVQVKGGSVPFSRSTRYCSGVNCLRQPSSLSGIGLSAMAPR